MTCHCKLIVFILRFYYSPISGGGTQRGKEFVMHSCWYSFCIPVGRGGREGRRNSECMVIVFPLHFNCIRIGERGSGDGNNIASVLYPYCDLTVYRLEEEEGRGDGLVIVFVV